jgi:hypothetical protein
MSAYPLLLIALGIVVLLLGKRVAVLGAAVGALVGMTILALFGDSEIGLWAIVLVAGLAVAGFVLTGLAKGIVDIILLILCILGGAAIVTGFFDLFNLSATWANWLFALVGALIGWGLYKRFHETAVLILAGLIGGLLVTRGLTFLLPGLAALGGWLGTLLVIVLAGASVGYQSGYFAKRRAAAQAKAEAAAQEKAQADAVAAQQKAEAEAAQAKAEAAPTTASSAPPAQVPAAPAAETPAAPSGPVQSNGIGDSTTPSPPTTPPKNG